MRPQAVKVPEAYRNLAKLARKAGWEITRTGGNHLRWQAPSGAVVYTASTPSKANGYKSALADFRRVGLAA